MKHRILIGTVFALAAAVLAMPSQASSQQSVAHPPGRLGYMPIELDHGISWNDAASIASTGSVVGFRYAGAGVLGEVFGGEKNLQLVEASLVKDYGYAPAITDVLLRGDADQAKSATASSVIDDARSFASYSPDGKNVFGRIQTQTEDFIARASRNRSLRRVVAAGGPEAWAPTHSEVRSEDGDVDSSGEPTSAHTVTNWIGWDPWTIASGYGPEQFPEGWVLESELNTYSEGSPDINPGGFWQRPVCPVDGSDAYFWSGYNPNFSIDPDGNFLGWGISSIDQSLVPEAFGAYLDYNLALDDCDRKAIGIGIAYPQEAPRLTPVGDFNYRGFIATIYLPAGVKDSSPVAAGYQLVSNDCDPGSSPNTNCTGIDSSTGTAPPDNYTSSSPIASRTRGFRAPGCIVQIKPALPESCG